MDKLYTIFFEAVKNGDYNRVKKCIKAGVDVYEKDKDGHTALFDASHDHTEVIKALLEAGAYINANGRWDDRTPLMLASNEGDIEIVGLLLERGAKVNAVDDFFGQTALHYASCATVVELLLAYGAKIEAKDEHDRTALHKASEESHTEVVKLLLKAGADIEAKDDDGETTLMKASAWGHIRVVKLLLDAGANINAKNKDGETALDKACDYSQTDYGRTDVMELLEEHAGLLRKKLEEKNYAMEDNFLNGLIGRTAEFCASASFVGARPGCTYKLGPHGLGYYLDGASTRTRCAAARAPAAAHPRACQCLLCQWGVFSQKAR